MKIIFMGTPEFAIPILRALHQSKHEITGVVTQPDRPKGRGREPQAPPVKQFALSRGLKIFQPEKASDPACVETLSGLSPDLIVVVAYGQILKESLLNLPKHFCMNLHASLLPKYRGAAPINRAIMNGDQETGVTTMKIDRKMDAGDILLKQSIKIDKFDTAQTLHDKLCEQGAALVLQTIDRLEANDLKSIPQDDSEATYAGKLKKEDGLIRWDRPAETIRNQVRGVEPWPGAFTFYQSKRLRLCQVETAPGEPEDTAGTLVRISDHGIEIGTAEGRLIVTEIQPEGKKRMSAKSFLQGHPLTIGDRFTAEPITNEAN